MIQEYSIPEWLVVSRETQSKLERLCSIVEKWSRAINLVSKPTIRNLWERHVLDSAQLLAYVPPETRLLVDLGSGGGFPGLVIGILSAELRPQAKIILVESDKRKAVFLSEAARELGIAVNVKCQRVNSIPPINADVISARAFASLTELCRHASVHLALGGLAIFPKGAGSKGEIDTAQKSWRFSLETKASRTDSSASILLLKDIVHV